jgi:hypothetical protein
LFFKKGLLKGLFLVSEACWRCCTQAGLATHIVYNNGTLNFSRYLDPAMTPPEGIQNNTHVGTESGNKADNSHHTLSDGTTSINLTTVIDATTVDRLSGKQQNTSYEANNINKETESGFRTANGHDITPKTRKAPFQVPFNVTKNIVTPHHLGSHMAGTESSLQLLRDSVETNTVTQGSNVPIHRISALITKTQPTIYDSALLNKKFKPNPNDLTLDPDIKPLRPLILSQHEAFTQTIQELGITSIMLTKIIEKKKESCQQIKDYGKIPRSLRLKCVLTTSPSYIENPDFLRLKEKLQDKTDTYIKEGTDIMAEWAAINIKLLSTDRCHDILSKALQILDGLISYSAEIIGVPNWPSAPNNNLTPLLLKLYLSGRIFNISNIANYLELAPDIILEIGIKIL